MITLGQPAEQPGNPRGNLRFGLVAIRQARVVRNVHDRCFRELLAHLAENGQAAYAGIEQQDRGSGIDGHCASCIGNGGKKESMPLPIVPGGG